MTFFDRLRGSPQASSFLLVFRSGFCRLLHRLGGLAILFRQPFATLVIHHKADAGDDPAHRVAVQNGGDFPPEGNHKEHPQNTQAAHAAAGKDHGDQRLTATADCAGQNLDAHKGHIIGHHVANHHGTDLQHCRILGEHAQENARAADHQYAHGNRGARAHGKADMHTLSHPAVQPCAIVLAREGGDGDAVSAADHPEKAVHLGKAGPGCHRIGAEGVDAALQNHVGNGVHVALNAAGMPTCSTRLRLA